MTIDDLAISISSHQSSPLLAAPPRPRANEPETARLLGTPWPSVGTALAKACAASDAHAGRGDAELTCRRVHSPPNWCGSRSQVAHGRHRGQVILPSAIAGQ